MMKKVEVSSFWHTRSGYRGIGLMELLSIKSWLDHGYAFCLYVYDPEIRFRNSLTKKAMPNGLLKQGVAFGIFAASASKPKNI